MWTILCVPTHRVHSCEGCVRVLKRTKHTLIAVSVRMRRRCNSKQCFTSYDFPGRRKEDEKEKKRLHLQLHVFIQRDWQQIVKLFIKQAKHAYRKTVGRIDRRTIPLCYSCFLSLKVSFFTRIQAAIYPKNLADRFTHTYERV